VKVNKISYKRLTSFGNFQNRELGAEATLEEGDDILKCVGELKEFVESNNKEEYINTEMKYEIEEEQRNLNRIANEYLEYERKVDKMKEFLRFHGVEVKDSFDDVPF